MTLKRVKKIEKGTFYPNSKQGGASAPVASPAPAALLSTELIQNSIFLDMMLPFQTIIQKN